MKLVDKTIQVNAPADLLYELLTDAEHFVPPPPRVSSLSSTDADPAPPWRMGLDTLQSIGFI